MDPDTTKLFDFVQRGDLQKLRDLVEDAEVKKRKRGSLLDAVDHMGWPVLHCAAYNNKPSIIEWILSSGGGRAAGFTKIFARDHSGATALHTAVCRGHLECCQDIVEGCMENGEREEMMNAVDATGNTMLHFAAYNNDPSIIKWLLSSEEGGGRAAGFTSSSITATTTSTLESALHCAADRGSVECLNTLLSGCTAGERLSLFLCHDFRRWTVLHWAARWCQEQVIRELLLHYPETKTIVDARDHRGMTALHRAVIGGIDEDSRQAWRVPIDWDQDLDNVGKPAVVAALLTIPKKIDNNKEKKDEDQQLSGRGEEEGKKEDTSKQQAAVMDPNLGTKIQ